MKLNNSYKVKILNANIIFKDTILIYREAVNFILNIVKLNWDDIYCLCSKEKYNYIEKLIHKTKNNSSQKYDFDSKFDNFPPYLRRAAIAESIRIFSTYKTNLSNYNEERYNAISHGKKFKKKAPILNFQQNVNPFLYKERMFKKINDTEVELKLLVKNKWIWQKFKLKKQDVNYILKNCSSYKELSPNLKVKNKNAYLIFAYESQAIFCQENKSKIIVAVDLNLNTSAVVSAMQNDGTIIKRKFINQPLEKDRLNRFLKRQKKIRSKSGKYAKIPKSWNKINNLNREIVNRTVSEIINFAIENNADCIVFEYLNFQDKKPKMMAMKLQMWCVRRIQEKVKQKAHTENIRFSRVCAKNTSLLAYDGSGKVVRNKSNYSICTFENGKTYNCDLNATYNIGARYFIRQLEKTISEKKWLQLVAKVPQIVRRSQCTLSTLIDVVKIL